MNFKNIALIAGVAVGAYVLYTVLKPKTTSAETTNIFSNAGFEAYNSTSIYTPNVTYANVKSGDTTYRFKTGDFDKLNIAQKFILWSNPFRIGFIDRAVLG